MPLREPLRPKGTLPSAAILAAVLASSNSMPVVKRKIQVQVLLPRADLSDVLPSVSQTRGVICSRVARQDAKGKIFDVTTYRRCLISTRRVHRPK
jgi:hypothetical protein